MRATLPEAIPRGKQFSAVRSPAGVPSARCSSSAASGCPAPYPGAMVEARKVSLWHNRYELTADGERLATWEGRSWRSGGTFDLAGRRYDVRSNAWGSRFEMTDQVGMVAATAERVGRRQWTVEANGRSYEFRRASMWRSEQILVADGRPVGSIRRVNMWRGDAVADLPGLPPPVQVFVLAVVLSMWDAQAAAAAST